MGKLTSGAISNSSSQLWCTPRWFLRVLEKLLLGIKFFDLDPCCSGKETACAFKWFTEKENGLLQKWFGKVFVNPPWNDIATWVEKAKMELPHCRSITFLLPCKPETGWFKELWALSPEVYIVRPRLNYWDPKKGRIVSGIAFTSVVVYLKPEWVGSKMPPRVFLLEAKKPKGATR